MKQNINNNRPVYVDGCKNKKVHAISIKMGIFKWTIKLYNEYKDGHAWVVDGHEVIKKHTTYSNGETSTRTVSDLVHCNWGWGGTNNEWYYFGTWNNAQNEKVPVVNYIYKQRMIHNIKPINN